MLTGMQIFVFFKVISQLIILFMDSSWYLTCLLVNYFQSQLVMLLPLLPSVTQGIFSKQGKVKFWLINQGHKTQHYGSNPVYEDKFWKASLMLLYPTF